MEQDVLELPEIASWVGERYVAIRVDKDRRPDIDDRYAHGGWPTLAFLDEEGQRISADTWLPPEELNQRLELVSDYYAENREEIQKRLAEAAEEAEQEGKDEGSNSGQAPDSPDSSVLDWVAEAVLETADPDYGGWGSQHKFPHPEAIDFALVRWSETGDERLSQTVLRTLRCMQAGQIHDQVEGGFYRYATRRDWSQPNTEKMLDSNVQRLFAYLEAYQVFGDESFRQTAEGVLRWLDTSLLDSERGAYRGSQDADPQYSNLTSLDARKKHGNPPCDQTLFTHWNAMAASALFKASAVLDEPKWSQRGLQLLEFLTTELFDERQGMYHYWDGTYHLPGMLADQAYTLRALLDAAQHTGDNHYLPIARRIADLAIESLRSDNGAFYDKRYDPQAMGHLRQRNRSLLENAVMAEALLRLSYRTYDSDYRDCAQASLTAFAQDYKRYGHYVAGYGRAVDLLLNPPVQVTIVGSQSDPQTKALRDAALKPYVASRIVTVIDPELDAQLLAQSGLPAPAADQDRGVRAYVQRGKESYAESSDPVRLPALMSRIERGA